MSDSKQNLFVVAKRLGIVLIFFQVSRVIFFIANNDYFQPMEIHYIISAVLWGVLYDITSILICNTPFVFVAWLFPVVVLTPILSFIQRVLFVMLNFFLLTINLADVQIFQFTNRRTSYEFFSYSNSALTEILHTIPSHLINYGYLLIPSVLMIFFLLRIGADGREKASEEERSSWKSMILSLPCITLIALFSFAFRCPNSKNVLQVIPVEYSAVALNTPFTIMESLFHPQVNYRTRSFTPQSTKPRHENGGSKKINVVILILESFSTEYMGYFNGQPSCTPFLDSLCKHSLVCNHAYANGLTTLEALPAILASIPSLGDRPFILSAMREQSFQSLPKILNAHNYSSAFFYGARNGNLGIENFAAAAGFEKYYGRNEYDRDNPGHHDSDGYWGIFDEQFLQYFSAKLDSLPQPFLGCLLTLSSHTPFVIPEQHRGKFDRFPKSQMNSIMYTDYSLKSFFKTVENTKWFNETLFIITGDHVSSPGSRYYLSKRGLFSIPIIYFSPSDRTLSGPYEHVTQQCDIMPSVIDYMYKSYPQEVCGHSIFDSTANHFAVMKNFGVFQYVDENFVVGELDDSLIYAYDNKRDTLSRINLIPRQSFRDQKVRERMRGIIGAVLTEKLN